MVASESAVDWDAYARAKTFDQDRATLPHHRAPGVFFQRWFGALPRSSKILEIGCGSGYHLDRLREAGFSHVRGIDISEAFVALCKQKGLDVARESAYDVSPNTFGERFDVVILHDVIEHLERIDSALSRAFDLLLPGGRVYIVVPVYDSWLKRIERRVFGQSKLWQAAQQDATHVQALSRPILDRFLRSAGFAPELYRFLFNPWPVPARMRSFNDARLARFTFGGRFGDLLVAIARRP